MILRHILSAEVPIVWEGEDDFSLSRKNVYREKNLKEILETLDRNAYSFYDYVMEHENALFVDYLYEILDTMFVLWSEV